MLTETKVLGFQRLSPVPEGPARHCLSSAPKGLVLQCMSFVPRGHARTNRCPGIRRTSRLSSSTLSVAMTWPAVMPVRAIRSSTAVG